MHSAKRKLKHVASLGIFRYAKRGYENSETRYYY